MRFGRLLPCLCLFIALSLGCIGVAANDGQAAKIPFKQESVATESALPKVVIGLLVIGVLAVGVVYVLRQRIGIDRSIQQSRQLTVVETQRLNPRLVLYVVEFSGQRHLIAHSDHGVTTLASAPSASALQTGRAE